MEATKVTYRNPKRTNLETQWEDLKVNLEVIPRVVHSVWDLELAADLVQQAIFSSCYKNCPANVALSPRRDPWWNKELSHCNASARQLFNKAKWTGNWESYKTALTNYNKDIRKAKWPSQWNYCGGTEDVPDRAQLMRIMASQSANREGSIKLPNG
jgi:hypothetical protein